MFLFLYTLESDHDLIENITFIVWRNRPMREVITFRNFKERECATVAER
jgi:hypothetical protein